MSRSEIIAYIQSLLALLPEKVCEVTSPKTHTGTTKSVHTPFTFNARIFVDTNGYMFLNDEYYTKGIRNDKGGIECCATCLRCKTSIKLSMSTSNAKAHAITCIKNLALEVDQHIQNLNHRLRRKNLNSTPESVIVVQFHLEELTKIQRDIKLFIDRSDPIGTSSSIVKSPGGSIITLLAAETAKIQSQAQLEDKMDIKSFKSWMSDAGDGDGEGL
jgi:hypothetical protein